MGPLSLKEFLEMTDSLCETSKFKDIDNLEVMIEIYDPHEIILKDKNNGNVISFPLSTMKKITEFIENNKKLL